MKDLEVGTLVERYRGDTFGNVQSGFIAVTVEGISGWIQIPENAIEL